jgi:biotin transport system substrate-specific component
MTMTRTATPTTIAARAWPRSRAATTAEGVLRTVAIIAIGNAALALAAHVQVPFWPVKLSMQSFVVLAIGLSCGSRLAGATLLAYLAEGAIGLPVFQGGMGLAYMAGPTGGYLAGFLLAAMTLGALAERGVLRSFPAVFGAVLLGEALIYLPGVAWLGVLFGADKAFAYGLLPFLPAECVKMALAMTMLPLLRRAAG